MITYIYTLLLFLFIPGTILISAEEVKKKALIFGVTGQDGAYLSELLLKKGYEVHGMKRRASLINTERIIHLKENKDYQFFLHYGDLSDSGNIFQLIQKIRPDEIYNLGAQSHVQVSFAIPEYTGNIDALGTVRILEAIRSAGLQHHTKFYQASTSELYGDVKEIPQHEGTSFQPQSPYAIAKLYGFWITKNYREAHGMFACNGILFNHESPLRGETFVTQKIVRAAVAIKYGLQETLYLGNLEGKRDWGHARDFVEAMWLMLQQEKADDFVVATGESHSVREFAETTFAHLGITIQWEGTGLDEKGIDIATGKTIIRINPIYFRPAEVNFLLGDASKAKKVLNWTPKTKFAELIQEMVLAEVNKVKARLSALPTK